MTDEELITNYYSCDDEAFVELYRKHYPRLVVFFLRSGFRDSEDLAEEVFLRVVRTKERRVGRWKPPRRFKPWLYAIATNVAIDELRRLKSIPILEPLDREAVPLLEIRDVRPGPEELLLGKETDKRRKSDVDTFKSDVHFCLGELEFIPRLVLLLRAHRMTQEETAGILSSEKVGGRTWSDSTVSRIEKEVLSALIDCLHARRGKEFMALLAEKEWKKALLGIINGRLVAEDEASGGRANE